MKSAIVGLGGIGKLHFQVLRDLDKEIVALCDCEQSKLEGYSQYQLYQDYEQMLDEARPDVVHVCTPHCLHTEMIIKALERNINVLCEKPLCIKDEDIPLIIDAERRSNAQLGICFQNRYNLTTLFLKEYLKNKRVISAHGSLVWRRGAEYYAQDKWRGKIATEGGGVLINQAIHTLDLLQNLVGMPEEVVGWCSNISLRGVTEVEDTATVFCRGRGEFSLSATNTGAQDFPIEISIRSEDDDIVMTGEKIWINGTCFDKKSDAKKYGKDAYGSGHKALIDDFYDCVKTGRKFEIDGAEGAKAVRIVLGAYASKGSVVKIKN